jgi:hypothetical protein
VLGSYLPGGRPPVPPDARPKKGRGYRAGKKTRLAAGVAAAGACVLLAACSPVKMGAAAIVGSNRITTSSLDSQASNLSTDLAPYRSQLTGVTQAELVNAVLGWLVSFQVQDKVAASEGITTSPAQAQEGLNYFYAQGQASAQQNGQSFNKTSALPLNGVPQDLATDFGQFIYQQVAFEQKNNGGKLPSTQAEQTAVQTKLAKASCQAEKSLNVQVSPQFGQLTASQSVGLYSVIAGTDSLSRAAGQASPAPTASLPSC